MKTEMNYSVNGENKRKKKLIAMVLVLVLLIGTCVGATIAWLTKSTDPVVNTFTYGDVDITLEETEGTAGTDENHRTFKVVPGTTIDKDPVVTLKDGSEACYLFIHETKEYWPVGMTYSYDGWTSKGDGWFVKVVEAASGDQQYNVLNNKQIVVDKTVSSDGNSPELTFTAYAIQKAGLTGEEALKIAKGL